MNINYVFLVMGIGFMVWAVIGRDWLLLFSGFTLALSGWTHRNHTHTPWVRHPTVRDVTRDPGA